MKKQIFKVSAFFLFALLATVTAYAQDSDRVWSIGPEAGANFSKWVGDDVEDADFKAGLVAGGFVTYSIRDTYGFTAKVLFSQKGTAYSQELFGEDVDVKTQFNYIEVPILARVFFNREGTVRPNVFLGPSFGFLTGAKVKVEDEDYEDIDDYKDSFNTFDMGVSAGLGLNVRVADEMYVIVDARYTYGLSDFVKGSGEAHNSAVAISAGLSFGIGN